MHINFLNYSTSDKIRIILESKDISKLYLLLSEFLRVPMDKLEEKISIKLRITTQNITLEGKEQYLAPIFLRLTETGMQFESVTENSVRISIHQFISKLR